ncbi:MAG: excinuclease ABC subunit C, partial [Clostridia bacterium]|nr:excinuclease ABC subunit C [Clostridia bacterium]
VAKMPDLIVVDGGRGQANAAKEATDTLGYDIPIIALAEKNEEIFLPYHGDPIVLPRTSPVLKLLQAIRDEAHRFAITYHRTLRNKSEVSSELDEIKGVGDVKKQELFKHFKQIGDIKKASVQELASVNKIDSHTAKNIYDFFRKQD